MKTIALEAPAAFDCHLATGWLLEFYRGHRDERGILEIDFSNVRKIDSVGVSTLVELNRRHGHPSERLRLINVRSEIVHALEVMGVYRDFAFGSKPRMNSGRSEKPILIIEDEGGVRNVAGLALRPLGYPVIECENAFEGSRIAVRRGPCLIVLDYLLPGMNGADMLGWLKQSDDTQNIPVMMMSSNDLSGGAFGDAFADAAAIFRKPFSAKLFRDRAASLIAEYESSSG